MKRIRVRKDLINLAEDFGVRSDWHEPDNRDITATFHGVHFDSAGFWGPEYDNPEKAAYREMSIRLYRDGEAVAEVNLATLLAWASGYRD